jgi:hypothetical protein
MIYPVTNRHGVEVERIDALETADVIPVLQGIRTSLVMGVDATDRAEEVLSCERVELVHLQDVVTTNDRDCRRQLGGWVQLLAVLVTAEGVRRAAAQPET